MRCIFAACSGVSVPSHSSAEELAFASSDIRRNAGRVSQARENAASAARAWLLLAPNLGLAAAAVGTILFRFPPGTRRPIAMATKSARRRRV